MSVSVHFDVVGSGPAVLFVHSGVTDSRMWDQQFGAFGDHQLIRFDMRGYGRSDLGSERFSNADDAIGILDDLGVETAVVVGCSVGGNVALQIASQAPDRLHGLVLVGTDSPGFDPGIDYQSPEWPDVVAEFQAGDMVRAAELEAEIWLAGIGRSTADMDTKLVDLFVEMDLIALRNESDRDELEASNALEGLPNVDVPVLVVVGELDIPQMHAAANHLSEKLSAQPAVVIAESAHLPSMDQPEAFNRALGAFLTTL
jgi:pimeloyl-ACP methyl ester carboxylesterase